MSYLHTDFWMDRSTDVDVLTGEKFAASKDYTKLAATQRAISNFVNIVTGKSIPVKYSNGHDSYTDGKHVVISSKVDDSNFDHTVGLALHEGSHCALTDFTILDRLKSECIDASDGEGWYESWSNLKDILNYVEDRRIDFFIYSTAPGYKAYYKAMYAKYFEANIITKALKSGDKREVTRENYMFRIINLTNTATDLDALPGLRDIWDVLDLRNIKRLKSTSDAMQVAYLIDEIITANVEATKVEDTQDQDTPQDGDGEGQDTPQDGEGQDTPQDGEGQGDGSSDDGSSDGSDDGSTADGGDAVTGSNDKNPELSPRQHKQLDNAIEKQRKFMDGDITKSKLSRDDSKKVQAMTEADVDVRKVGKGNTNRDYYGNTISNRGVDCCVIKNMTRGLIDSGIYNSIFASNTSYECDHQQANVVNGTRLGTMLGRKLQVRNEDTTLKTTRLRNGKIDRRLVSSLGYGAEAVFAKLEVDTFNPVILYLSIDASGSMHGDEWNQSQTAAVAIAKAASMVSNMDVVITYRSTDYIGDKYVPVMLIAYDSRKDKFSKITNLFQYIRCSGTTPEGLCFEAIMKEMVNTSNNTDTYFINFSDGMPGFNGSGLNYYGHGAVTHTRNQVEKMKANGIKVLSYFISSWDASMGTFKQMYGSDAEKIDPSQITKLARSLNKKFATKG